MNPIDAADGASSAESLPSAEKTPSFRQLRPTRREFRDVLGLALPVASVQVGMMFMGVVDTIMVGHFSARDLAAVALGNLYFFTVVVFPMGLLMSLDPVVSQAVGAGDRPAVGRGPVGAHPGRPGPGPAVRAGGRHRPAGKMGRMA